MEKYGRHVSDEIGCDDDDDDEDCVASQQRQPIFGAKSAKTAKGRRTTFEMSCKQRKIGLV